jgi:hypothetical protein
MVEARWLVPLRRLAPGALLSSLFVGTAILVAESGTAIPAYTRRYDIACATCHVHVPKLNEFGFLFAARGAEAVGLKDSGPATSLWVSTLAGKAGSEDVLGVPNRAELISLGELAPTLTYFAEWRLLSKERLSSGAVRDRSGRFEDLYLTWNFSPSLSISVGQQRAATQYDVSHRLSISEPSVMSTSVPGWQATTSRITSLRAFSPGGRSPLVRVSATLGGSSVPNGTTLSIALPFPGELSIPLTREAEDTASPELDGTPKGVFLELYHRHGLNSVGAHHFEGRDGRAITGFYGTAKWENVHAFAGYAFHSRPAGDTAFATLDLAYVPRWDLAAGVRFDGGSDTTSAIAAYASVMFGPIASPLKLAIEARAKDGSSPAFSLELSYFR